MVGRGSGRAGATEVPDPEPDTVPSGVAATAAAAGIDDATFFLGSDDDGEKSLVPQPLLRRRARAASATDFEFCILKAVG